MLQALFRNAGSAQALLQACFTVPANTTSNLYLQIHVCVGHFAGTVPAVHDGVQPLQMETQTCTCLKRSQQSADHGCALDRLYSPCLDLVGAAFAFKALEEKSKARLYCHISKPTLMLSSAVHYESEVGFLEQRHPLLLFSAEKTLKKIYDF